jgi:DNA-binding NarL/FixJ family response regulator
MIICKKKGGTIPMVTIRLFIVEDQPTILRSQIKLLAGFPDIDIVGSALSAEEALRNIKNLPRFPNVILCDLGLPQMSGTELTKEIKKINRKIEVLIFTVFEEEDKVLEAIRSGACGYLLKGAPAKKIHESIHDVFMGGTVIQPTLARRLLKYFKMPLEGRPSSRFLEDKNEYCLSNNHGKRILTIRELECLQMIAKGLSNNEAAGVLNLSKATIRTHLEHIYQKLDVTNRVEAVTEGIRQGIIEI